MVRHLRHCADRWPLQKMHCHQPSPIHAQEWSQIDQLVTSCRWFDRVLDRRLYRPIYLDSDHALIYNTICLGYGCSKRSNHARLNTKKLGDLLVLEPYQTVPAQIFDSISLGGDEHWKQERRFAEF